MSSPDFVVVGHVVRDLVADGWRLGGTVTFAAMQAHRLGASVGVVTAAADDVAAALPFADVRQRQTEVTTSFENLYAEGRRRQRVPVRAAAITQDDVPAEWRMAPIVLLGPVLGEVDARAATIFSEESLIGVSAQGFLREVDAEGRVVQAPWRGEFWSACDALFVSEEDLSDAAEELATWTRAVPIVALTESRRGARVHADGRWRHIDAFPESALDPTGAGDTFATAFLVRLHDTGDVDDAARFGEAAASMSVGGQGASRIASRAEIEERLSRHPEVALR